MTTTDGTGNHVPGEGLSRPPSDAELEQAQRDDQWRRDLAHLFRRDS